MDCLEKGRLKMKTTLLFSVLLLTAVVTHAAPAIPDKGRGNSQTGRGQSLVTPIEEPAITAVPTSPTIADDPKQVLQEYDSLMIGLTQKFSATLATIALVYARQVWKRRSD